MLNYETQSAIIHNVVLKTIKLRGGYPEMARKNKKVKEAVVEEVAAQEAAAEEAVEEVTEEVEEVVEEVAEDVEEAAEEAAEEIADDAEETAEEAVEEAEEEAEEAAEEACECEECAEEAEEAVEETVTRKAPVAKTFSVINWILGLLTLPTGVGGVLFGILSLIFGGVAKKKSGKAAGGIVMGIIELVAGLLLIACGVYFYITNPDQVKESSKVITDFLKDYGVNISL